MSKKKIKLLVVDDEKDICKFIKILFRKKGFLIYSSLSGRGALKLAPKIKPDIALLDIYLKRGISGLDTLKRIRKICPSCRCIMVTWDKAKERIRLAKDLGAVTYLVKPLTIKELLKAVKRVVKSLVRDIKRRD